MFKNKFFIRFLINNILISLLLYYNTETLNCIQYIINTILTLVTNKYFMMVSFPTILVLNIMKMIYLHNIQNHIVKKIQIQIIGIQLTLIFLFVVLPNDAFIIFLNYIFFISTHNTYIKLLKRRNKI